LPLPRLATDLVLGVAGVGHRRDIQHWLALSPGPVTENVCVISSLLVSYSNDEMYSEPHR
jgi:hypothetical protein